MTSPSRRSLLLGGAVGAVAAALAIREHIPLLNGIVTPDTILNVIEKEFGSEISSKAQAQEFALDFSAHVTRGEFSEAAVTFAFIRATTIIRALETEEDFIYVGLEDLRSSPCRNTLSATWL
ncbi:hypothetical protein JMM63_00025 [Rhodovulum sulfidophilum]|uniref:hypothetical protein n=1 Tax=Rhodovulum sulfidophilum TaxID=35806 RepID=UPI0019246741|nr:hypothetical protein [Rhodovulum sulfidophilum]MBL3593979.1 hypothetical protein [Rhodovulum sulfidophilum]